VRISHPTVEGKLAKGWQGLDVGTRLEVRLLSCDTIKGFIDFAKDS